MKPKNIYLALRGQLPWNRFFRNFLVNGNGWGLFSIYSHINRKTGKPKIEYDSLQEARKAADSLRRKYGRNLSAYKCMFCDGYHIGNDRTQCFPDR